VDVGEPCGRRIPIPSSSPLALWSVYNLAATTEPRVQAWLGEHRRTTSLMECPTHFYSCKLCVNAFHFTKLLVATGFNVVVSNLFLTLSLQQQSNRF
jgi:hypothetical protein